VLGVPDERWGEVGVAVVVVRQSVKPDALIEWCKARIATFKVPHSIRFADSLPRSGMDKVLKGELAARLDGENHDI
jgi:fatty-acyl-CoA synthase